MGIGRKVEAVSRLGMFFRGQFQDNLDALPPGGPQFWDRAGTFPLSPCWAPRLAGEFAFASFTILHGPVMYLCILIKTAVHDEDPGPVSRISKGWHSEDARPKHY
eukprot:scaffold2346_cov106-Skeletonema_dohrnii-CCMP3373.AAC.2